MKIYYSIRDFQNVSFPVLTTGTFDGVHLGHQTILDRLKIIADEINGETVLLTFSPHPRLVLFPEQNDLKLLTTREEKIELLERCGVDHLIIHPFTKEFSRLSSVEFIRDLLVSQIKIKRLVIGYNHQFGRNREGKLEHLLKCGPIYGFEVDEIPAADIDNVDVSSTKIRNAIRNGDVETARAFLGQPYMLSGEVVKGDGLGSKIGYPTANLYIENEMKLIPADGVYAVSVLLADKEYKAMMNIGLRPTVQATTAAPKRKIEIHIFEFDQDIYGKQIRVNLIARIRDEVKFDSLESLAAQLEKDKESANKLLSN